MANQPLTACRQTFTNRNGLPVNCDFEGYVGISKLAKQLGNTPPVVLPPFDDTTLIRNYYDSVNTALNNHQNQNIAYTLGSMRTNYFMETNVSEVPEIIDFETPGYNAYFRRKCPCQGACQPPCEMHYKESKMKGEAAEVKMFDTLIQYFSKKEEDAFVFFNQDLTNTHPPNWTYNERDVMVVNLSKKYVLIIEVKSSVKCNGQATDAFTGAKQLRDSKEILEKRFDNKLKNDWKIIRILSCKEFDSTTGNRDSYVYRH